MNIVEAKAAVRAEMAAFRIRPEERAAASNAVCQRIINMDAWRQARVVLSYAALADEICLQGLFESAKRFAYPRFHVDRGYAAAVVTDLDELLPGKFGILEPLLNAPEVSPGEVDLVLVPGVAFDSAGNRLGRGRGFYDRWLESLGGLKVGVGFDHQLIEKVPTEPHDMQLDAVAVPSRTVMAG